MAVVTSDRSAHPRPWSTSYVKGASRQRVFPSRNCLGVRTPRRRRWVRIEPSALQGRSYDQRAIGVDAEYSRSYWLVRSEVIWNQWQVPALEPPLILDPLSVVRLVAFGIGSAAQML